MKEAKKPFSISTSINDSSHPAAAAAAAAANMPPVAQVFQVISSNFKKLHKS